ncbi:hypothetical protein BDN72DRAFT_900755 [Pluteus cervinus]|uniref:Uncharacterized protein n=1 Tax=Pluteus cervinus TaxID=181527 RepID=A0ACD3AIT9_9AGAR|nr:hypothetical protein BDN72DRAFT_900755 [Pluteus cervinus]
MVRTRSTKLASDIKPHAMSLRPRNEAGLVVAVVPYFLLHTPSRTTKSKPFTSNATGRTSAGSKVKSEALVNTTRVVKEEQATDALSLTGISPTPTSITAPSNTVCTAPSSAPSTMTSSTFTSGALNDTAEVIRRATHASLLANETYSKLVDQARHLEVANAVLTGEARGHQESFNRLLNTKFPGRRRK